MTANRGKSNLNAVHSLGLTAQVIASHCKDSQVDDIQGPELWLSIFRVSFCRGLVFARRSPNTALFGVRDSRRMSLGLTLPNSLDFL